MKEEKSAAEVYISILSRIDEFINDNKNKWEAWSYPEWKTSPVLTESEMEILYTANKIRNKT